MRVGGMMTNRKIGRREALLVFGAAGAALGFGCGSEPAGSPTAATPITTTPGTATGASCAVTPSESIGPYPSHANLFRGDIREGKAGTTLTLTIAVVNTNSGCSPVSGANVGIWQCDASGNYSEYGAQTTQSYLRGIQTTNASGQVSFTTIYPGWYQGRATHIHIEVVRNGSSVKVTQIAFPEAVNAAVYGSGVYASRGSNPTANARDGIFADSLDSEVATVSGDPANGYTATFTVGIAA
jgi:protocatechuate 3,4-dioxygenase beta subunit